MTVEQEGERSTTRVSFTNGYSATIRVGGDVPPFVYDGGLLRVPDAGDTVSQTEVRDPSGTVVKQVTSFVDRPEIPEISSLGIPTRQDWSATFSEGAGLHARLEGQLQAGPLSGSGLLEASLEARLNAHVAAGIGPHGLHATAGAGATPGRPRMRWARSPSAAPR